MGRDVANHEGMAYRKDSIMDLSYPVGRYQKTMVLSAADRQSGIDEIAGLPKGLRGAVRGLTEAQLDTPYRPDGWTVRQVVHHVADSHLNAYCRIRLALTEENPTIKPYAQAPWAELVDARTMPVEVSLTLIEAVHARWLVLMQSMKPDQFQRVFSH